MELDLRLVKAARALAGWSAAELSKVSGVPHDTLRAFESGRTKSFTTLNAKAVHDAFSQAGIVFIPENGGGAGVRLANKRGPR